MNATSQADCTRCPDSSTSAPNSTRLTDCLCLGATATAGFFNNASDRGEVECVSCVVGTNCSAAGADLHSLSIRRGFWRPSARSIDVRRCPDSTAGCAVSDDTGVCNQSNSGCVGGNRAYALCRGNLSGAFCRACPRNRAGDDTWVYYRPATQTLVADCAPCDGVVASHVGIWVALLFGVCMLAYAISCAQNNAPPRVAKACRRLWDASMPQDKLKVMQWPTSRCDLMLARVCDLACD
jgi:hypothetical protein